jgi:choline-sulfatase
MTDAGAKRPNILILMVDQLNGTLFPGRPGRFPARAEPEGARSSARSRFANSYTASPLCAPGGRASCPGSCRAAPGL